MRREIGQSGVRVLALGYGEWPLSNVERPSQAQAHHTIRTAVESGIDLIDTADAYCLDDTEFGHGERLVRDALAALGEAACDVMVATKVGLTRPGGGWQTDGRPERIRRCCEASLERLGVETIDLYQLHTPDPDVPIEDSVGAMAELQRAGKIRLIGVSNVDAEALERARSAAEIATVQNECNAGYRVDVDSGLVDACARLGVTYVPWYPLGGENGGQTLARSAAVTALARKHGVSAQQVLLRWLLDLGDHVLPIPGARRAAHVRDGLGALELELDEADRAAIASL